MTIVKINCPTCDKKGSIDVLQETMKNVTRGLLAVNIADGIVCDHTFIVYIDKNFNVRDYFTADFQVELPQLTPIEKIKATNVPSKEVLDVDLIRLNIPSNLLVYILKSIFSKQKIVLISDQDFLYDHIKNFFKYITQDSFKIDLTLISKENYKNKKKDFKEYMVFKGSEIIKDPQKILNAKKLLVEKAIVGKFLNEHELGFGYIILKNEIQKAHELVKLILDFIKTEEENGEKINILKIQTELENQLNIKINTLYLKFLIEIVEYYYELSVPSLVDGFFGFL